MVDRVSGVVFKACVAVAAGGCLALLAGCSGGSGGAPSQNVAQQPVTQSNITLPSSVQVVSAK